MSPDGLRRSAVCPLYLYAAYGISTYRYENWETKTEMYTTEEYDAIKAAYNAAE